MSDAQDRKNRVEWARKEPRIRLPEALNRFPASRRRNIPVRAGQKQIRIFRGVPPDVDTVRPGDWVSLDVATARELHRGRILEMTVPVGDVAWAGTDEFEWFYVPAGAQTQNNPVEPRLEYIAKNYKAGIVYLVTLAWLEAVGRDVIARDLQETVTRGSRGSGEDVKNLSLTYATVPHQTGGDPPKATRFDRHLPWLAKAMNNIAKVGVKAMSKAIDKITPEEWKTAFLNDGIRKDEVQATLLALLRHPPTTTFSHFYILPVHDARIAWNQKTAPALHDLVARFRAIVDWAEAENIDLGNYSGKEAVVEASVWGRDNVPSATVSQGPVVFEFGDGWTAQRLNTQALLDDEGQVMQHCVADFYDPSNEDSHIYSLRDPKGQPHVTIEWIDYDKYVGQVKGKQNDEPKWEYLKRAVEFRLGYLDGRTHASDTLQGPVTPPPHADGLSSRFLGAYNFDPETFLIYANGAVLTAHDLEEEVDFVTDRCREEMHENYADDIVQIQECVVQALDDVDPLGVAMSSDMTIEDHLHWDIWKLSGSSPEYTRDEMISFLNDKTGRQKLEARALVRASRKSAANPRRPAADTRRAELKRRLMR